MVPNRNRIRSTLSTTTNIISLSASVIPSFKV